MAAALVLVLAGTAAAATIAIHQYVHHVVPVVPHFGPVTRQCSVDGIHMVDSKVGWNGSNRTTDGGKTWHDASPPQVQGSTKGPAATCALDGEHAWALVSTGTGAYEPTQLVLLSTADGGRSWQQASAIAVPFAVSWKINFSAELDFIDEMHGWLLMEYATLPMQRRLYATSDGGANWSIVSRASDLGLGHETIGCHQSGIMFATLKRGWLTWNCQSGYGDQGPGPGPVIAVTSDGGATWTALALPLYPVGAICGSSSPIFSGDAGAFELSCLGVGRPGQDIVYSTVDGGQIWFGHRLNDFATVDFINGTTGFYFTNDISSKSHTLMRTTDSGATWVVVKSGLFRDVNMSGFTFIDVNTGFADVDGPAPWWTYDGGKTWSLPAPYHSVGDTVCPIFSDPGAGPLPQSVKMVSPAVGWAAGTRRTTDGGATWTNVSPPPPTDRSSGYGEFFLDATHAWVADAVGSNTACADRVVVYSTSDGGATWHSRAQVPVQLQNPQAMLIGGWRPSLDFIDTEHGWLTFNQTAYISRSAALLYSTADGGLHWTLVSRNLGATSTGCYGSGPVEFLSTTTGYVEGACVDQTNTVQWRLLATTDGGVTWNERDTGVDTCCGTSLPFFLNASEGWLLDNGVVVITTDGGATWRRLGLPRFGTYTCQGKYGPTTCPTEYIDAVTFVSPDEGWLITTEVAETGSPLSVHVERTLDGGRSWSVVYTRNVAGVTNDASSLTFVDANNGFWWSNTTLFRTTDGGRTWTAIRIVYG